MKSNTLRISVCLLVFLCLFGAQKIKAQGTLQFNQVIAKTGLNSSCYLVPQGKVFKLEAMTWPTAGASGTVYFGGSCGSSDRGVLKTAAWNLFAGTSGSGTNSIWPFPQWYPEGTYIFASDNSIAINGIEFNVIP